MTLMVPDKAQARGLVLTSLIAMLSALQLGGGGLQDHRNNNNVTSPSHRVVAKYFGFLTKLARSNKTAHRAYR